MRKAFVKAQYAGPSTNDFDDDLWVNILETMEEDNNNDLSNMD
jgi:hypothetical protein